MMSGIFYLLIAVLAIAMARKGRNSRYSGYRKLPFTATTAAGTVNADDVTSTAIGATLTEERRILSMQASHSMRGITAGDGPVAYGVAHSDYTAAEIEECLEALGAWDEGDLVAQEQSNRLVRQIGTFTEAEPTLNEGRPVKTRLNWLIASGDTLQFWILNGGIQMTTGMEIIATGDLHTVRA